MIDWQRVTTLRDEIGAEDFEEVVPLFLEEVTAVADALRDQPDPGKLEERMHLLKGSALNLGFSKFSSLCHAGEIQASKGQETRVDVVEILDCFEASKGIFLDGLPKLSGS